MPNKINLSLVIPIYNQAPFVEPTTLAYLHAFTKSPLIGSFEIILVSNNCSDNTPELCAKLAKKHAKIKHLDFPFKIYKAGAVMRGFQHATHSIVGFTDADMATAPEEFLKLVPAMQDEKVGAAIASRKMPDSVLHPPQPFSRRVLGASFRIIRELLFGLGIKDSQCGAKLFRSEAIVPFELKSNGFAFDVELLYRVKQRGMHIKEIGITWRDQPGSTLFAVDPWVPLTMLRQLIQLRLSV